jgi:hypothetical protein
MACPVADTVITIARTTGLETENQSVELGVINAHQTNG